MITKKTLTIVQYTALIVAVVALFAVLFLMGDTDRWFDVGTPGLRVFVVALGVAGAILAALIQVVGYPAPEPDDAADEKKAAK